MPLLPLVVFWVVCVGSGVLSLFFNHDAFWLF